MALADAPLAIRAVGAGHNESADYLTRHLKQCHILSGIEPQGHLKAVETKIQRTLAASHVPLEVDLSSKEAT